MIIKGIKASNFMRFEDFSLSDLPSSGLIGIFGENESGKSSIGELISFCMYGKNTRAQDGAPDRIIRWGKEKCEASMDLMVGDQTYRITRSLGRNGRTEGKLEAITSGELIVNEANEIESAVSNLIGYGFKEFRYSTFIAQNELDIILRSADDRRDVLNNMLGVGFMEKMAVKMSSRRVDREKEIHAVRKRLEDKQEVMHVYLARERDMEALKRRLDKTNEKLLGVLREREHLQSTLSLLEEVRRKAELFHTLDERIKERREKLKEIDQECARLLREADKAPLLKQQNEQKKLLIEEIREGRMKALQNRFKALDKYRELGGSVDSLKAQIEAKQRAVDEVKAKIEKIENLEKDLILKRAELLKITEFLTTFIGRDRFENTVAYMMKDVDLLESELTRVRFGLEKDIKMVREKEENYRHQLERLNRQIDAATVQDVDRDQLNSVQTAERKAMVMRDVSLGLGGMSLLAGVILPLALENLALFAILALIVPTWGSSIFFMAKVRNVAQQHQQLQQHLYAFNITQRSVHELHESKDEISARLTDVRKELDDYENLSDALSGIETNCFADIEAISKLGQRTGIHELERASELGGKLLQTYDEIREVVTNDKMQFPQMRTFDPEKVIQGKKERKGELEIEISNIEPQVKVKDKFVEQAQGLHAGMEDLKDRLGGAEAQRISLGVTEEDLPQMQKEEKDIENQIVTLEDEIELNKKEITRIELQAEEAGRLEEKRRTIVSEIDEDLIKYYELKESTYDIDYSEQRFESIGNRLDEVGNEIEEHRETIREIDSERKVLQKDLDRIPQVKADIEGLEDEIKNKENYVIKLTELDNLYRQTGANIKKRLVPQIEAYFGWVLPRMTRNRYHRVKLDESFDIKVFSKEYGDYVNLDVLSGGTIDQLMISLRLAFARATFSSPGSAGQFLFLDEPFSSFDESRREQFFNLLTVLKTNFQQIFLISHLPHLEDFVDYYMRMDLSDSSLPVATSWIQR